MVDAGGLVRVEEEDVGGGVVSMVGMVVAIDERRALVGVVILCVRHRAGCSRRANYEGVRVYMTGSETAHIG